MIRPRKNRCLALETMLLLSVAVSGQMQDRKFIGQVFAYNPWAHLFKVASAVKNQEIVIFKLKYRRSFVKVVFAGFGQQQLDPKYLNGSTTIAIRGIRDPGCDEDRPRFFGNDEPLIPPDAANTQGTREVKIGQKYRLTDFFSKEAIPQIERLDCYRVEMPRK